MVESPDAGTDAEFRELTEKIARERDFRCSSYKDRCLRRRIAVRMRARGAASYAEYMRILDGDVREYDLLLDALTINVTKLFRNWDVFEALGREVIPALWAQPEERIVVWSAGCASGEEPYSLAILFHRHAAACGEADRVASRVVIHATDIDRASLAAAERGVYQEPAFADTPAALRAAYFPDGSGAVPAAVKRLVRFHRHDLLRDPPPAPRCHLVVCRNVIIYFDRPTQEALFERFHDALAPGGFLVLGKVETLLGPARARFAAALPRERIFRRA